MFMLFIMTINILNLESQILKPQNLRDKLHFSLSSTALYEKAELEPDFEKPEHLIIGISSDRGLCGGIHSSIAKAIRASIDQKPEGVKCRVVAVGDKVRSQLFR